MLEMAYCGAAGEGEDPADRKDDLAVGAPDRSHRADLGRQVRVEDGGESGDAALDDLFVDDVGLVDAVLRMRLRACCRS